jgi:hypothetical protein
MVRREKRQVDFLQNKTKYQTEIQQIKVCTKHIDIYN